MTDGAGDRAAPSVPDHARAHTSAWRGLSVAAAGGIAFALTAPPTDLYPAVLVGLALLAASIAGAKSTWRAFGRGALWGTAAGVVGLRFVPAVIERFTSLGAPLAYLALVLLAAAQSLVWAIGAAVAHAAHHRARAPRPIAFAAGTLVAVSLPTVFAWTPAGLVSPWPAFVQLADVVGERGVSVLFALSAALAAKAAITAIAHRRATRAVVWPAAASVAIVAALGAYGALRMRSLAPGGATVRVGLVDQAVGPLDRWKAKNRAPILASLRALTADLERRGAELVVWPEAAYPYPLDHDTRRAPRRGRAIVGGAVHGPVLFGLIMEARPVLVAPGRIEQDSYNSATLVSPDGTMQPPYDKLELLWFGETVPLGRYFPWLRRLFQRSGGLVPGVAPRGLVLRRDGGDDIRLGVLNCYEDTLPSVGRRVVGAIAPSLLVNVTNDAWFVGTAEPELHARLAAMRAIEHRRDLVRAVNLGVTSWIDARGVVRLRDESASPNGVLAEPTVRDGAPTLYDRFGDVPMWIAVALTLIACFVRARRAERRAARA